MSLDTVFFKVKQQVGLVLFVISRHLFEVKLLGNDVPLLLQNKSLGGKYVPEMTSLTELLINYFLQCIPGFLHTSMLTFEDVEMILSECGQLL